MKLSGVLNTGQFPDYPTICSIHLTVKLYWIRLLSNHTQITNRSHNTKLKNSQHLEFLWIICMTWYSSLNNMKLLSHFVSKLIFQRQFFQKVGFFYYCFTMMCKIIFFKHCNNLLNLCVDNRKN